MFLCQIFREHIVAGAGQSVASHTAVIFFFVSGFSVEARPTITSPGRILALLMTSARFMRQVTVESTIMVRTSRPHRQSRRRWHKRLLPYHEARQQFVRSVDDGRNDFSGTSSLLRRWWMKPKCYSTAPTQSRSSMFIISASCNAAFHNLRSPVSFQATGRTICALHRRRAWCLYSGSRPEYWDYASGKLGKIPLSSNGVVYIFFGCWRALHVSLITHGLNVLFNWMRKIAIILLIALSLQNKKKSGGMFASCLYLFRCLAPILAGLSLFYPLIKSFDRNLGLYRLQAMDHTVRCNGLYSLP